MVRYYKAPSLTHPRKFSYYLKLEKARKVAAQRTKARNARHVRRMQRI